MTDKCPKCGRPDAKNRKPFKQFACMSFINIENQLQETIHCLQNQRNQLLSQRDNLRDALSRLVDAMENDEITTYESSMFLAKKALEECK